MKTKLFIIFFLSLAIIGCNEQAKQNLDIVLPDISVDENADAFAKILSSSMNNHEMLDFIKEMAEERFDGDENFLIMDKIDDKSTKSSNTFYDMLSVVATKSESSYDLDSIIEAIKVNDPLLQVYVMNSELWDSGIEPLVVLLPENYDDERICTLTGYKMNGEVFTFSSENEIADAPVVVLSRNERTIVKSSKDIFSECIPFYSNEQYNYYYRSDVLNMSDNVEFITKSDDAITDELVATKWKVTTCGRYLSRPSNDYVERVTIVSKTAWKDLESTWLGEPDLELFVVHAERISSSICKITSSFFEINNKKAFNTKNNISWYSWKKNIMLWSLSENGDKMVYAWNEHDSDNKETSRNIPYTINVYGFDKFDNSYPISVSEKDEDAGYTEISYIDKQSTIFTTNNSCVKFEIKYY